MAELEIHHETAENDPQGKRVGAMAAIIAILLALVTILSHRAHTSAVVLKTEANDQWAYYQAKNIRRHADDVLTSLLTVVPLKEAEAADKVREKYAAESERYRDEIKEIETKAHELEGERDAEQKKANRFDLGEVLLEIALVVTSITLLTGKKAFWYLGLLSAAGGIVAASSGFLLH